MIAIKIGDWSSGPLNNKGKQIVKIPMEINDADFMDKPGANLNMFYFPTTAISVSTPDPDDVYHQRFGENLASVRALINGLKAYERFLLKMTFKKCWKKISARPKKSAETIFTRRVKECVDDMTALLIKEAKPVYITAKGVEKLMEILKQRGEI